MLRRSGRYHNGEARYVDYFAQRREASIYTIMEEAQLEYEEAIRVILTLCELKLIQKVDDTGEKDINKYVYELTYKGLKYYLEHRKLGEGRERLDEAIRLHYDKSVVLKHLDAFKEHGLDNYIVERFRRMHEYRLPRGYLDSIRYFQKPDDDIFDAVEVLGLDYLVMEEEKAKKMLARDYEPQMKLFEALRRMPELNSIWERYFNHVENRAQHVIDNIKNWRTNCPSVS